MTQYSPPGVTVQILENTRIISLGEGVRLPAIVGVGPAKIYVENEQIQRGTGSTDYLSVYPASGVQVSAIKKYPFSVSSENLWSLASASINANGAITWNGSPPSVPSTGEFYYVDYSYNVPPAQYQPTLIVDKNVSLRKYGPENNTTGILSTAISVCLENGAPGVLAVQVESPDSDGYQNALDKLLKFDNVGDVVLVFPSGSITKAQQEQIISRAVAHLERAAAQGKERSLICGSPSSEYASGGFDEIGNITNPNSYVGRARILKNKEVTYVVPSKAYRFIGDSRTLFDGNMIAAAIAGKRAGRTKVSQPLHGAQIYGLVVEELKWTETEMDLLGSGSCTVVYSVGGATFIRDHITTDPTSADTQEPSIRDQEKLVIRSLRDGLKNTYIGKGIVITPQLASHIEGTTESILRTLVTNGLIYDYGKENNPLTGETKITAVQSKTEPRRFDVTCSVKYLYPLKWISVTVSVYV